MLRASAAPGLPGLGTSAGRAGQEGTKAARLREGARRGEERAQPGATWSGGSWRESQRVGGAGGARGGGRGWSGRKAGSERRRQAARGARSCCRGGWTQPSYPPRGERGWHRAVGDSARPRAFRPLLVLPQRGVQPLARLRAGWSMETCWVLKWEKPTPRTGEKPYNRPRKRARGFCGGRQRPLSLLTRRSYLS